MNIVSFIIRNLVFMHKGTVNLRIQSAFILSLFSYPFTLVYDGLSNWFNLNIEFISFLFVTVIIDHLIGSYVHAYIKKDFTLKQNLKGLLMKTSLIIVVFIIGHGMVSILGKEDIVTSYFNTIMRLMVFLYPAGSALVNCSIITKGKFPPLGFMDKVAKFNNTFDLSSFKEENTEE